MKAGERQVSLRRHPPRGHADHPTSPGPVGDHSKQRGFADPRLASHDHSAAQLVHPVDQVTEYLLLAATPHQGRHNDPGEILAPSNGAVQQLPAAS